MGHLVGNLNLLLMSLILTVTLLSLRNVLTGILSGDYNPLEWRHGKSKNIWFLRLQTPFSIDMLSEENDNDTQPSSGPKPRKTRKLHWERSKLRNIKAKLDETYSNRVSEKQWRVSATVPRGERSSTHHVRLTATREFPIPSMVWVWIFSGTIRSMFNIICWKLKLGTCSFQI